MQAGRSGVTGTQSARRGHETCRDCGGTLDYGERCDCQSERIQLVEALLREIERVRDVSLGYQSLAGGSLAGAIMQRDIDTASEAIDAGNVIRMVAALLALRQWQALT